MGRNRVTRLWRFAFIAAAFGAIVLLRAGTGGSDRPGVEKASSVQAPPAAEVDLGGAEHEAPPASRPVVISLGSAPRAESRADGSILSSDSDLVRRFTREGFELCAAGGRLRGSLRDLRLGGRGLALPAAPQPEISKGAGGREAVVYRRGPVTERYELRPDGVEQILVLDRSAVPQTASGDLSIGIGLESSLRSRPKSDQIEFADPSGNSVLTYGSATAIDATGRTQPLSYHVQDGRLEMVLAGAFVAQAAFPLTIDPTITVKPALGLTFNAPLGGPNPAPQVVTIKNTAASGTLRFKETITTTSGGAWLTASPPKGVRHAGQSKTVTVSVLMTTLAAGDYSGNIKFFDQNDATNFVNLPVTLHVHGLPFISVSPSSLTFNAPAGSGVQPVQTIALTNLGGQTMTWSSNLSMSTPPAGTWLTGLAPSGGSLAAGAMTNLSVSVDATGLAAGTYTGTIQLTGNAQNAPFNITVTLNVNTAPFLDVSPLVLNFSAPANTPNPIFQNVVIRNSGGSPLNWNVTTGGSAWLSINPTSGTGVLPGVTLDPAFSVGVSTAGLAPDTTYFETITIGGNASNAGDPSTATIQVSFTVTSTPVIDAEPPTLVFNAPLGGPDPAPQIVTVTNQGGGTLNWTGTVAGGSPWLMMNQTAGSDVAGGYDSVQVVVSVSGLAQGQYSDTLNFDDGNGNIESVFVQLSVNSASQFSLNPTSLVIDVPLNGSPANVPLALQNVGASGASPLSWTATIGAGAPWLSVGPPTGSLPSGGNINLTVTADPTSLAAGSYSSQITFTDLAGVASPQVVGVTLNVNDNPKIQLSPTSLVFDVPAGGAAVQQTVTLQDVGGGADLNFVTSDNAAWLDVTPTGPATLSSGGSTGLVVTATPGALAAGTYTGLITVGSPPPSTDPGFATNSPQLIFVIMNVNPNPKIGLSPGSLEFDIPAGSTTAVSQPVTLSDVGDSGTPLNFSTSATTSDGAAWLAVAPPGPGNVSSGSPVTLTVTVNPTGLAAGAYSGLVKVSSTNGSNAPQFLFVVLNVSALPRIGLNPTSLSFSTGTGINPPNQSITVSNTGGNPLGWSASSSMTTPAAGTWLSLSGTTSDPSLAAGTSEANPITVVVTVGTLTAGTYSGTITITAPGATNSPQSIPVTLTVLSSPVIGVNPTSLTYTAPIGTNPTSQTVTVSNNGGQPLNWGAAAIITTPVGGNWLSLSGTTSDSSLAAGTSEVTPISVDIDTTGLAGGTYSGIVRITGAAGTSNSPQDIPVTLNVLSDPSIGVSPAALVYTVTLGSGNPSDQTVTVTNTGGQPLNWSAASSVTTPAAGTWLSLSGTTSDPSLGAGLSETTPITVSVDVTGLAAGTYTGSVTITGGPNTTNSPVTVGVTLNVNLPAGTTSKVPKAGYPSCGSVGLDLLWPLGLLWGWRKLRRRSGRAGVLTVMQVVFVAAFALGGAETSICRADEVPLPRSISQEEPPPRPTTTQAPAKDQESKEDDLIDLEDGSVDVHAGILSFSSKFKAHTQATGGVELRTPSPLLSSLISSEPDRIGMFLDLAGSAVKRNLSALSKDSGGVFFATAGLDAMAYRDEDFQAHLEAGVQYGYFGGVTGLQNGAAGLVGLRVALNLGGGVSLSLNPQASFANAGNRILFLSLGVDFAF